MPLEIYFQDTADTVRDPLLMLDTASRMHSGNYAFYRTLKAPTEEARRQYFYELVNLFQTFTQADPSSACMAGGLGLHMAPPQSFCRLMSRGLTVNSVPGKTGALTINALATAGVLEPHKSEAAAPTIPEITIGPGGRRGAESLPTGGCILVIDDDEAQRDLMRRFLTKEGFIVHTASDGEEGLHLARRLLPVAITLDVMMPGMDGWTVLSELKSDPSVCSIPVIMLTIMDDSKQGYALGAAHYLTKPTERKRLAQILKTYREQCGTSETPDLPGTEIGELSPEIKPLVMERDIDTCTEEQK